MQITTAALLFESSLAARRTTVSLIPTNFVLQRGDSRHTMSGVGGVLPSFSRTYFLPEAYVPLLPKEASCSQEGREAW